MLIKITMNYESDNEDYPFVDERQLGDSEGQSFRQIAAEMLQEFLDNVNKETDNGRNQFTITVQ
jgi:hypothetical protein